jgi:hypothetical protein
MSTSGLTKAARGSGAAKRATRRPKGAERAAHQLYLNLVDPGL